VKLVNAGKKVPESFLVSTLQTIKDNVDEMVDRFTYIPNTNSFNIATWNDIVHAVPELQQTVSNMISQLNAQSLIDLTTLQTALDNADGSLETIANILQEMQ
jgi:hypothetical protein